MYIFQNSGYSGAIVLIQCLYSAAMIALYCRCNGISWWQPLHVIPLIEVSFAWSCKTTPYWPSFQFLVEISSSYITATQMPLINVIKGYMYEHVYRSKLWLQVRYFFVVSHGTVLQQYLVLHFYACMYVPCSIAVVEEHERLSGSVHC